MYIYKITNLLNNRIYVGKCARSIAESSSYFGSGIYIENAIKKHGKQNFRKDIIQECQTLEELNDAERYWIATLNSTNKTIGYNINAGGDGLTIYHGKTKDEIHEIFMKLSMANKRAWQKILDTYSENELKELYDKKSNIANTMWAKRTKKERDELRDKIAQSNKNNPKLIEATKKLWTNRTEKDKKEIGQKIKAGLKKHYDDKGRKREPRKPSGPPTGMWSRIDKDKYDIIMDKKSNTMKNKYRNDPKFSEHIKNQLRKALCKQFEIINTETNERQIVIGRDSVLPIVGCTLNQLKKRFNGTNSITFKQFTVNKINN